MQNVTKVPQLAEVYYSPLISATKILRLAICNSICLRLCISHGVLKLPDNGTDTDTDKDAFLFFSIGGRVDLRT